jgi:hypothetical protein
VYLMPDADESSCSGNLGRLGRSREMKPYHTLGILLLPAALLLPTAG